MKGLNSHIQEYLDSYIQIENPGFAVLVKGQWGSGKTYFIKKWKEAQKNPNEILYVSLYGLERVSQIDSKLMLWIVGDLDGKWAKLTGKFKVGAKAFSVGIKEYLEKKYELSLPDIGFSDLVGAFNFNGKTIIFDDLERYNTGELSTILGYINNFVEHKGVRVIILGDESKISDEKIKQVKEKTIGKTFDFKAEIDAVLDVFIKNISENEVRVVLEERKSDIRSIFTCSKLNNLRILRQSLLEFERFFMFFNGELRSVKKFQQDVLSLFLILSLEIHSGNITDLKTGLDTILEIDLSQIIGSSKEPNKLKKLIKEKYVEFDFLMRTLSNKDIWQEYFEKNQITKELLDKELKESSYLDRRPDWLKLWRYMDLEDDTFACLTKRVFEKLNEEKIDNVFEAIHVSTMLMYFNHIGLFTPDKADILAIGKKTILRLSNQLNPSNLELSRNSSKEALGYGYHGIKGGSEIDENKKLLDFFENKIRDVEVLSHKEAAEELLELYKTGKIREAHELLYSKHRSNPILAFIKAEDFLNAFDLVKNEKKILIVEGIEKRYERTDLNPLNEESFFAELDGLIKIKLLPSRKSISRLYYEELSRIVKYTIEKIKLKKTMGHGPE